MAAFAVAAASMSQLMVTVLLLLVMVPSGCGFDAHPRTLCRTVRVSKSWWLRERTKQFLQAQIKPPKGVYSTPRIRALRLTQTSSSRREEPETEDTASNTSTNTNSSASDIDPEFQRRNKQWVVLVDDEESIRYAVGDFLYDRGYEVTACSDSKSLLDLIVTKNRGQGMNGDNQKLRRLPDLIISDVRMPESDKNGYELVQFLRSADTSIPGDTNGGDHHSDNGNERSSRPLLWNKQSLTSLKNLPIVLLTAKAMTDDRIMGYKAGADVVLPKPFSPEELVSIIDNLIRRRQQRLQPRQPQPVSGGISPSTKDDDLRALQNEIDAIKAIVLQNASTTVRKTDVVLNDRDRTVVSLLAEGYTAREIASAIKPKSLPPAATKGGNAKSDKEEVAAVKRTITSLCERTGSESKTDLIRWALKVGYISPS